MADIPAVARLSHLDGPAEVLQVGGMGRRVVVLRSTGVELVFIQLYAICPFNLISESFTMSYSSLLLLSPFSAYTSIQGWRIVPFSPIAKRKRTLV